MALPLIGVIFSRDRAMQLDAALRSFYLHCADAAGVRLVVLYHTTNHLHARQYAELVEAHRSRSNLRFLPQTHFWRDLLGWLAEGALAGVESAANADSYRAALRLGRRFSFLRRPLLRFPDSRYVMFLVDDALFIRNFRLADAIRSLEITPQAVGFSLRLGTNTTHCYTMDRPQKLPAFVPVAPGILSFEWTGAELDFGYPLEVSSSIYRIADLLPYLDEQPFANPNQLESRLAEGLDRFQTRPQLLCFVRSVAFSNPVNKVNDAYRNRAGETHAYTSELLADRFAAGYRIDVSAYSGIVPNGCHQELELHFIPREEKAGG